jgi:hypothetical protein
MVKGVNKSAQTARIFRVGILQKNCNDTPLTRLPKSSTCLILVTSDVQRGNMFCQNAGRHKQNSTISQLTKETVLIFFTKTSNLLYITGVDPDI